MIYSTGKISISNTTGTASGSQMVVIEGKNSATVTNSKLTASGQGNRNNVDNSGIMIYQSMSGDASKQTLTGNISLDKLSTLTMKLSNSSTYTGTINAKDSAKKISLTLDSSSKIKLTGDSYVTSLNDADSSYSNIDFNGYKLYVNGKAINK